MASKSAKRLLVNKVIKTYVQAAYGITEPFGFFLTDLPIVFSQTHLSYIDLFHNVLGRKFFSL